MLIRYTGKTINNLSSAETRARIAKSGDFSDLSNYLIPTKVYEVFALSLWNDGGMRAYIHSSDNCYFPLPYPFEFFEVVDSYIAEDWVVSSILNTTYFRNITISFQKWALDETFYERLVEGDLECITAYEQYLAESKTKN